MDVCYKLWNFAWTSFVDVASCSWRVFLFTLMNRTVSNPENLINQNFHYIGHVCDSWLIYLFNSSNSIQIVGYQTCCDSVTTVLWRKILIDFNYGSEPWSLLSQNNVDINYFQQSKYNALAISSLYHKMWCHHYNNTIGDLSRIP